MNYLVLDKDNDIYYEAVSLEDAKANCPSGCNVASMTNEELDGLCSSKEDRPNPDDYSNDLEGDASFYDAYWQGNAEAELFHDDIGDK